MAFVASKLLGVWPPIWRAIVSVAREAGKVLLYSGPVPISATAVLLLAIVLLWRLLVRYEGRISWLSARLARAADPAPREEFHPSPTQDAILKMLADADGQPMHPALFPQRLSVGWLLIDQAFRGLEAEGIVRRRGGGYGGSPSVSLTEGGQDYVIRVGYAPPKPR